MTTAREKVWQTHGHQCPRCNVDMPGYRHYRFCNDKALRWCGLCLAKLFFDCEIVIHRAPEEFDYRAAWLSATEEVERLEDRLKKEVA